MVFKQNYRGTGVGTEHECEFDFQNSGCWNIGFRAGADLETERKGRACVLDWNCRIDSCSVLADPVHQPAI